jgi:hypothetical protein
MANGESILESLDDSIAALVAAAVKSAKDTFEAVESGSVRLPDGDQPDLRAMAVSWVAVFHLCLSLGLELPTGPTPTTGVAVVLNFVARHLLRLKKEAN